MLQLKHKNIEKPPVWLVDPSYGIGTAPSNSVQVSGQGIHPQHASIEIENETILLRNLVGDTLVRVNGIPVTSSWVLTHGDEIQVGSHILIVYDPELKHIDPQSEAQTVARLPDAWSIVAKNTALQDRRYFIAGETILGRSKDCDISLALSYLSRKHAKLSVTDDGLSVEDLNSSNGTFVNGEKIQQTVLKTGDELSFDALKFSVVGPDRDDRTTVRSILNVPGASATPKPTPVQASYNRVRSSTPPGAAKLKGKAQLPEHDGGVWVIATVIIVMLVAAGGWWFLQNQ